MVGWVGKREGGTDVHIDNAILFIGGICNV